MRIHGADVPVRDLTRWNRAGLSRFRYVEGGAAEWLEYLRVAHMLLYARAPGALPDDPDIWRRGFETGALPGGMAVGEAVQALQSVWQQPAPQAYVAATADYRTALRAKYDRIPLDQTAQLQRAFVRAFHLLAEALNAYANEGYLLTATQETHLRRLLELIDFQPRLPASAMVPIALTIKADTPRQTVDRGLAAEYMPPDGNPILTFESLDALLVDPAANLLRPTGWDKRSDPIAAETTVFALADSAVLNVALAGTMGMFRQGTKRHGFTVTGASKGASTITVARGIPGHVGTYQETEVFLAPAEVHAARPQGASWLHFADPPACYVGQVVALSFDKSAADDFTLSLSGGGGGGGGSVIGNFVSNAGVAVSGVSDFLSYYTGSTATVQEVRGRDARLSRTIPSGLTAVYPAVRKVVVADPTAAPKDQVLVLGGYHVPDGTEPVGVLKSFGDPGIHVGAAMPGGLANGMPVALKMSDGKVAGAVIGGLAKDGADGFSFTVTLPQGYGYHNVVQIGTAFAVETRLAHEVRSSLPLFPAAANGALAIDAPAALDGVLKPGRTLLIVPDPASPGAAAQGDGMAVTIATATRAGGTLTLTFDEDLAELADFQRGHAAIHGNVAVFGHGKSLPEKVLGSGDATVAYQVMTLPAADIATRPDPSFPGGVVPDIEIRAGTRKLRLVAAEDAADPLQPSFVVRLAEDGSAEAAFLSRLPTGADNIRLTRFRQGSGAAGNAVPPFSIVKPTPKTPIIDATIQPLSPQFGADLEGAEALKRQGGSYFALLDRALSARDFARLAESTTNVWHANAALRRGAGSQGAPTVALTVVPAGGGSVEPIREDLTTFLTARAMPGTVLDILPYRAAPVGGSAVVNLKPGFARDIAIADEIGAALYERFRLEARALGRTLFVTEIVAAIEAHEAVQNLTFTLAPMWPAADPPRVATSATGAVQAVMPGATQVVFVEAPEDIAILWGPGGGA